MKTTYSINHVQRRLSSVVPSQFPLWRVFLDSVKAEFTKSDELVEVAKDYDAPAVQSEDGTMVLKELNGLEEKIPEKRKKATPTLGAAF